MKENSINTTFPYLFIRLWSHIGRQRQFLFLMILMLISAFAQIVSLGSVVPFLGVLVDPERFFDNSVVNAISLYWDITSPDQLIIPLTILFVLAALIAATIQMLLLWASTRLAVESGSELSAEVYRRTLYQPYRVHAARNSSEVISGITNKINGVVFGVSYPFLNLMSSTVLMIAILLTLIIIDPLIASISFASFGASYALITFISRRRLSLNSKRIAHEQTQVVKALQEGLGGIRDVLLDGTQPLYCNIYHQADYPLRKAQGNNVFIAGSPRPVMEAIGIIFIAVLSYALSQSSGGIGSALPVLGAVALGAQRLLPALQQIFASWASIVGHHASLVDIIELLDQPIPAMQLQSPTEPLLVQSNIHFNDVRFRYTNEGPWVLDGLNLTIQRGTKVGFVGSTGSGKSTALDLLMGLLVPSEGELIIDGLPINSNNVRAWQQTIAHVPQNIYLADTTVTENIAFGVPFKDIDFERVQQAASDAQLAEFIEECPEKYNTFVGEQGIRLSGGQRQRIGIARALYKQASILVFDEATSALDNNTERLVMDTINGLDSNLTVILIAHRITTVKFCDIIVQLEHGRLIAKGTYAQLIQDSPSFKRMADLT
ncbi:ABC transporter ATP-binding protein/permease [Amylibacter sp.]|nr:ABC transporter ATP-binding protein/permease [Amylibacter sp.]